MVGDRPNLRRRRGKMNQRHAGKMRVYDLVHLGVGPDLEEVREIALALYGITGDLKNFRSDRDQIDAGDCLVIEDSKEGIKGARRAGMKCLAVTNSHPAELLSDADAVVMSLEEIDELFLRTLYD